jgi:enoyl-CoA hydratase
MEYREILYEPGAVARVKLNRPEYKNAQSWRLREELDHALHAAARDEHVGAIVLSGVGGTFSAGHDIGTKEDRAYREEHGHARRDLRGAFLDAREINVENTLRWRNLPKPTIAMVNGYCIYGAWMIAAGMDVIFADEDTLFMPGHTQYFSAPWDVGPRKAKEVIFEHRFMTAQECCDLGFVNRVYAAEELEPQTLSFAERVAANYLSNPFALETAKFSINHMQDAQGFTAEIETAFDHFWRTRGGIARERPSAREGGAARTHVARENLAASMAWLRRWHGR